MELIQKLERVVTFSEFLDSFRLQITSLKPLKLFGFYDMKTDIEDLQKFIKKPTEKEVRNSS